MNKIINNSEKETLLLWIYSNKNKFCKNNAYDNRYYLKIDNNFPKLFLDIKQRIISIEKIENYKEENIYFGDLISYIETNGKVHRHMDLTIKNYHHCRYNVFLSLPEKGGLPIYNNKIIHVNEGEFIKCFSSLYYHESQKVIGNKPRILISYGFFIPNMFKYS